MNQIIIFIVTVMALSFAFIVALAESLAQHERKNHGWCAWWLCLSVALMFVLIGVGISLVETVKASISTAGF